MKCFVIHYHEIALKGKNRPIFIGKLALNIKEALGEGLCRRIIRLSGRLIVTLRKGADRDEAARRLKCVFGIANFSPATATPLDLDKIKQTALEATAGQSFNSFRITARRGYKEFPLNSPQINSEVGAYVKERTGARVDLERPELNIFIEITHRAAFIYKGKEAGPGGLPAGISGRVVCLLSGGIDSPVAAYRMMKRGCHVTFVHFHSYPHLDRSSQEKAIAIARHLTQYQYRSDIYLVPFGETQRAVVVSVAEPYRVIIYRRLMARIAQRIAMAHGAKALVTGESLGQVASQTLYNIAAIEGAATIPILRPLIGMDKEEITRQAIEIGTYETSIIPDQDCCQLFIPRRPSTRASIEDCEKWEKALDIEGLISDALAGAERIELKYPP